MLSPRYRPVLEYLESRSLPAVVVTTSIDLDSDGQTDDVRIVGDIKNNHIVIDDNSTSLLIDVDKNGDGDFTDPGELVDLTQTPADSTIVVDIRLGEGDDQVNWLHSSSGLSGDLRSISVDLGIGNDEFVYDTSGVAVNNSSELIFDIVAGKGTDVVDIELLSATGSLVVVQASMGGGADTANLTVAGAIGAGTSMDVDFDLGGGSNTSALQFEGVGGGGQAFMNVAVTGSNSTTQVDNVSMVLSGTVGNGTLPSRLSVDVDLLGGNDSFTGILNSAIANVAALSTAEISVHGGAGNDLLQLTSINSSTIDIDGTLDLEMIGGAGNDTLTADLFTANLFDLTGELRLRLEGSDGNDILTANLRNTAASTGNYTIALFGHAGNDTVTYDLEATGAAVTFGPAGVALLNGGLGSDTLDDNSLGSQSDHLFFETFV